MKEYKDNNSKKKLFIPITGIIANLVICSVFLYILIADFTITALVFFIIFIFTLMINIISLLRSIK